MNGPKISRVREWIISQGDAQGSLGTGWKPMLLFNPGNLPPAMRPERTQDRARRHYPPKQAKRDNLLTKRVKRDALLTK